MVESLFRLGSGYDVRRSMFNGCLCPQLCTQVSHGLPSGLSFSSFENEGAALEVGAHYCPSDLQPSAPRVVADNQSGSAQGGSRLGRKRCE